MTTPAANFNDKAEKAAPPSLMTPEAYCAMLEKLLGEGKGYGKTKGVGGYLMQDIKLETETSSGKTETVKNLTVEKLYVVMDLDQYKSETVRKLVIKDIAKNWGGKTVHERDLESPDFKGPGLWTIKKGSFEFDYIPSDPNNLGTGAWKPNPEAFRVTLTTDTPIKMPVQWGDFVVEKGGTVAIREKDVAELAAALQSIRSGEKTIEEALYAKDKSGNTVSKFDIYGMEPKFLENNYDPVALKAATQEASKPFAPSAATMPALKLKNATL